MKVILYALTVFITTETCNITFFTKQLSVPKQFTLMFGQEGSDQMQICFQFGNTQTEEHFVIRLDYLPFVCLQALNDIPMKYNGSLYEGRVLIKRLCKPLNKNKSDTNHTYDLIYEIRPAYKFGEVFLHKAIIEVYIPLILVLLVIAIWVQPFIFKGINQPQKDE